MIKQLYQQQLTHLLVLVVEVEQLVLTDQDLILTTTDYRIGEFGPLDFDKIVDENHC